MMFIRLFCGEIFYNLWMYCICFLQILAREPRFVDYTRPSLYAGDSTAYKYFIREHWNKNLHSHILFIKLSLYRSWINTWQYCHVELWKMSIYLRRTNCVRNIALYLALFHCPRLFNSIPATVRKITDCYLDTFNRYLDKYLRMLPDEPKISGYTALWWAKYNSLYRYGSVCQCPSGFYVGKPRPNVCCQKRPPMATSGLTPKAIHK